MLRRHPRKTLLWCYRRYLSTVGNYHYVWQASYHDGRSKPRTIRLARAVDTPIKRHIKIKAAANPYDPEWESYFEQRIAYQMKDNLQGYDKLLRIWYKQDGLCPNCDTKITKETGWHLHHRVRVVDGGDETMANLLLLHPTCHQQMHAQKKL